MTFNKEIYYEKIWPEGRGDTPAFIGMVFVVFLSITPFVALFAPRFLAYWPGIIGFVVLAVGMTAGRVRPVLPRAFLLVAGGIVALAAASSLWATDWGAALARTYKIALILFSGAALISAVLSLSIDSVKPWLRLIVPASVMAGLLCWIEMVFAFPLYRLMTGTEQAEFLQPARLNRSLIALLAFMFFAIGITRVRQMIGQIAEDQARRSISIVFIVYGLLLLFAESQSAQLGFLLAAFCYFFFPYGKKLIWHGLAIILALLMLGAPFLAISMFGICAETIKDWPLIGESGGFGAQRLEIWDMVARYATQGPFYGYGIEATRAVTDFETAQLYRHGTTELHPHNFAIQLWIEFNIIGACAGAFFLVWLVGLMSRLRYEPARIALPLFFVILTALSFGYGLWQSWILGLIVLAFVFVALGVRLHEGYTLSKPLAEARSGED